MEKQNDLNIVLIGMPGSGKSYIGSKLAKLLAHFTYNDIDNEIEEDTGLVISEIFEKYGEEHFRDLETNFIKEISKNKNRIISIGGGAFERAENREYLKRNGLVFYLKTSIEELFDRIKAESHRPLFGENFSQEPIKKLLSKREKNYLKADFVIDTDKKQAYTILDDILKEYENYVKNHSC